MLNSVAMHGIKHGANISNHQCAPQAHKRSVIHKWTTVPWKRLWLRQCATLLRISLHAQFVRTALCWEGWYALAPQCPCVCNLIIARIRTHICPTTNLPTCSASCAGRVAAAAAVAAAADTARAALSTVILVEESKGACRESDDIDHVNRTQQRVQPSDQDTGVQPSQYRCREAPHALAWLREFTLQVCLAIV